MINVGITGHTGFIGSHIVNCLKIRSDHFKSIFFKKEYFDDIDSLKHFVSQCDVIIHLAGISRSKVPEEVYETNVKLTNNLINALELTLSKPLILFSSSIHEKFDTEYGLSKKKCVSLLSTWAEKNNAKLSILIFPNVFGPFALPNYVSFIATFSHKLINNEQPQIIVDNEVELLYIDNLIEQILNHIDERINSSKKVTVREVLKVDFKEKVSIVLEKLIHFNNQFLKKNEILEFQCEGDYNLFKTFHSYLFSSKNLKDCTQELIGKNKLAISFRHKNYLFKTSLEPDKCFGFYVSIKHVLFVLLEEGAINVSLKKFNSIDNVELNYIVTTGSVIEIPIWYEFKITNLNNAGSSFTFYSMFNETDGYIELHSV